MRRREFLKTAGLGLSAYALLPGFRVSRADIPSRKGRSIQGRKLNIACVGIGGRGKQDVDGVKRENIVALCDVHMTEVLQTVAASHPGAKVHRDYRKMLREMDEQIDAVVVSTPDHMHFPVAMLAMQMGKHVYVEKPIAHTVAEARQMTELARAQQVVTQCGNQGRANEGSRLLVEWVRAGAIGGVREVHCWTNRPIWPQGLDRPTMVEAVPDTLDWNGWLGVAPERPYNACYLPFKWRGWWDFGCGALGDMGCHIMNAPFWALDLKYPTSVEAVSSPVNRETAPKWSIVTYQFPARGAMPPVKLVWYDGGKMPPRPKELDAEQRLGGNGCYLIGDQGCILSPAIYCESVRLVPETAMQAFLPQRPAKTIPRIPGSNQWQEWIKACKGEGPPPGSNFDYSGPLSETVLMGNLALKTGKKVEWDGPNMRCTNLPEANELVRKKYREY
ncbi:MAG: Gfo/Idh/MocA family oxidoreductase [Kiritimatiellaeota bacterium]|nr:Gfo/Idh/MocA family oxidoreductase [Kiritimatiellota bacterium]